MRRPAGADGVVDGGTEVRDSASAAAAATRTGKRGTPPHLAQLAAELRRTPTSFDFFRAVRILEQLRPELADVGRFVDPAAEVVRFKVNPSLAFPAAEIQSLDLPPDGPASMSVNFFGLTGPQGVLPYHYSLLVLERVRARDDALAAFLDLFHHRIISLFYRAWQKNQPTVCNEKQSDDRLSEHLLDLIGEGVGASTSGPAPLQRMLLFYGGLLGAQPRSALALEQLLEDVFDVPVAIEQFVGGWYPLAQREQCALGEDADISTQLGLASVVGDEVWDQQTRVQIRLGPLSAKQYAEFLPTGSCHELLRSLVRFFSRDAFDFEVQLVLERGAVRSCVLGDDTAAPLGWSTWIRTEEFSRDPDDTVLQL